MDELRKAVLELARLGMKGDATSVRRYVKKILKRPPGSDSADADLREHLTHLLVQDSSVSRLARSAPRVTASIDMEPAAITRVERVHLEAPPVLSSKVSEVLEQIVSERSAEQRLRAAGVEPTRSVLLTGQPGVGKTMTAHYLSERLGLPLLTLELSALMSSYLGRSGQNLRNALVHGRQEPCVLFLDEFDALGKRRDDPGDVGELKRIVNVLLLELDNWTSNGLLVAATNHPELLDKAVWRRFDVVLRIDLPDEKARQAVIGRLLGQANLKVSKKDLTAMSKATTGASPADITRLMSRAIRQAIVSPKDKPAKLLIEAALDDILRRDPNHDARAAYCQVASGLGRTQRQIGERLGISHVAVGKILRGKTKEASN